MSRRADPLTRGSVTFVSSHVPALGAGEYAVTISQAVSNANPRPDGRDRIADEPYADTKRFAVRGPRFALDPGDCVARFPPPDSQGRYENALAHVVLARRALPWMRAADGTEGGPSWLAVLLFHEDDPPPAVQAVTAGALGVPLEFGQATGDRCEVIEIPGARFSAIAPSLADLRRLAHVRKVDASGKPGDAAGALEYAIVVGNRLPAPNRKSTVHLVSLERLAAILPPNPAPATVRLVSLANWSFSSVDPEQTFGRLLRNVGAGPLQVPLAAGPALPGGPAVAAAFGLGYTGVDHRMRQGSRSVSWYRGPLLPFAPPAAAPAGAVATADEMLRHDPGTGMMDVSYAAAWQLGRLLALQDRTFSVALYDWKRGLARTTARSVAAARAAETFGTLLGPGKPQHAVAAFIATTLKPHLLGGLAANAGRLDAGAPQSPPQLLQPRARSFRQLARLATTPAALAELHATTPVDAEVARWLGALRLLAGVPFDYLVPDARALPVESLRFFHLDAAWVDSLVQGACSIGRSTTADRNHELALAPRLHAAAREAARTQRALRTGGAAADADASGRITGLLLRSQVVAGWPGLQVTAYDAGNAVLGNVLRHERLAPTLLLLLVEGVIHHVDISEPGEGLHFGVDVEPAAQGLAYVDKRLRYLAVPASPPDTHPGEQVAPRLQTAGPVPYRGPGRVIEIDRLALAIQEALGHLDNQPKQITAADFAVEMVEGVEAVRFIQAPPPR